MYSGNVMIAYKYIGIWKAKQINPESGKEKKKEKKKKNSILTLDLASQY